MDVGYVDCSDDANKLHEENMKGLGEEGGEHCSGKETELQRGVVVPETESWDDCNRLGHEDGLHDWVVKSGGAGVDEIKVAARPLLPICWDISLSGGGLALW